MKVELGLLTFAFFGGMAAQDAMTPDEVVWVDYGENPMENPEFMTAMMAASSPGAPHAEIAKAAGEWNVASKMWMDPQAPPIDAAGTAKSRMVLGGRYLMEEFKSNFMGMPYEGLMLQGYDNLKQEYFTIWMDNFSTWPSISTGQIDKDGKFLSTGIMKDISTPAGRPSKFLVQGKDKDTSLFEMFDHTPTGDEYKSFEMLYKRKAGTK